jgi:hypothetical protein
MNNENKPKQGFENSKRNLNLQAFGFWDFWVETILKFNSKFESWRV